MTSVVFYFQVHQPYRLRHLPFESGHGLAEIFDDVENRRILEKVAERCYLPVNELLLRLVRKHEGAFRCAFSLSGTVLQQLEDWSPEALESFRRLADTGCVELLCETSHHSLSFYGDRAEWREQVLNHRQRIADTFGFRPRGFRNTELALDEDAARALEDMGFVYVLGEGADRLLQGRFPHWPYRPRGCERIKALLRDYHRSDDIAFRFSNREWDAYPLLADTFAGWLEETEEDAPFIGLFMDYETFGEHQAPDTGILDFLEYLPGYVLGKERLDFATPLEVARAHPAVEELAIPDPVSWADAERDLSAWLGNVMQEEAHEALYALAPEVRAAVRAGRRNVLETWRRLTTSDHLYYMCMKSQSDGEVHAHFSPYGGPEDAYLAFMRALDHFRALLRGEPAPARRGRASQEE